MRTCKLCHKPIEHLHGNQEICNSCQPKAKVLTDPPVFYVQVPTDAFYEMKRNADIGKKINALKGEAKLKVLEILNKNN